MKYWKKGDLNSSSHEDSAGSRTRPNSYKNTLKQSTSTKRLKGRIISSPINEGNLSGSRSQAKLKSFEKSGEKPKIVS